MNVSRDFCARRATLVARDLLGMTLVRQLDGQRLSGRIVETEAYTGHDDGASHAYRGRTPRNLPMWGAPGHAYVYLTYGVYWLLNVTCEPVDQPAAVLLRAIEPLEGLDIMAARRAGHPPTRWTSGPGRLTLALGISGDDNRADLTDPACGLWIEAGEPLPDDAISTGPRVGLGQVPEPWLSIPWRFWITANPFVSR
ncbi:MAG: DNA-3-methyladenine glycosylase [Chloroflexi bacterium]|nr:DNA-3-methyladenine glycosylase [Chloroflexota bacterium]